MSGPRRSPIAGGEEPELGDESRSGQGDTAEMRIRCDPAELVCVRQCVRRIATAVGFGDDEVLKISLAVDEALTNVIRHGYGGPCDEPIDIRINQVQSGTEQAICVVIRDFAKPVDAAVITGRALQDVRPGGLGVHIMRTVMDEVTYVPLEDGGTRLTMLKKKTR